MKLSISCLKSVIGVANLLEYKDSKSFLAVMILMIRAILYPRANLFSTAGGKEQAAQILQEKIHDICLKIPAFEKEIDWTRGVTKESKDYCKYIFKSGSTIENLAAKETTRGRRMHGGVIEECVNVDQQMLQEVIIPTMNVSRRAMDGTIRDDETLSQSQIYITTAGYKSTFSYDKLIQLMIRMVTEPDKAYIMGGTWRIPVLLGLQSKTFITDLKNDPTFNEASFGREYESRWTGSAEDSFFEGEKIDRNRILVKAEDKAMPSTNRYQYYILSADIGRNGCQTVICVFKVVPQPQNYSYMSLVNLYTLDNMHFEEQTIFIKTLFYRYDARRVVIDANGMGWGIIDYMVKQQILEDGSVLPDFGIYNDPENIYKKYRTKNCEYDAVYRMRADSGINTLAHTITKNYINTGRLKFLINETEAKTRLLQTKLGKEMTVEARADFLRPYTLTSILKEEMLNLRQENEGINIKLKQVNKKIQKDKVSACEYGLYYIKTEEEDKGHRKKHFDVSGFMFKN